MLVLGLATIARLGWYNVIISDTNTKLFPFLYEVDAKMDQTSGIQCPSANGLHPNPASCTSYIQCSNGTPHIMVNLC